MMKADGGYRLPMRKHKSLKPNANFKNSSQQATVKPDGKPLMQKEIRKQALKVIMSEKKKAQNDFNPDESVAQA